MNEKFRELLQPHRYKILYGGRGSGKSWGIAAVLVFLAAQGRLRILCVREVQSSIKDSSYQLIVDTIDRLGYGSLFDITQDKVICRATGSSFIFKGLHNDSSFKSMEGIDICWAEEAHSVSEESWRILIPTIRKKGSEIWMSFNPDRPDDPTYRRFILNPPPDAWSLKVNFDENPYFRDSPLYEEMLWMREHDYESYLHVWEGFPRTNSDAQIFRGRYVVQPFPDDLWEKADRLFFGADFGFAKDPSTLVRCFMLDRTLYVDYEAWGVGVEIDELPRFYLSVPGAEKWPIHADSARPETISYLRTRGAVNGIPVRFNIDAAKKWQGSVEDGIAYLKSFDRIVVHPRCKHVADEFAMYSYKTDKRTGEVLPLIEDKWNHGIDAIRYALDGYITRSGLELWAKLGRQAN